MSEAKLRSALAPCPNCGSTELKFTSGAMFHWWAVFCTKCFMHGPETKPDGKSEDAEAMWNSLPRREALASPSAPSRELREGITQAIMAMPRLATDSDIAKVVDAILSLVAGKRGKPSPKGDDSGEAGLREWVRHKDGCESLTGIIKVGDELRPAPCTCGLNDALARHWKGGES